MVSRRGAPLIAAVLAAASSAAAGCGTAPAGDRDARAGAVRLARVERVVDGDTVRLSGAGRVRLIGIDAPEVGAGRTECLGPEASAFARRLLPPGMRVQYEVGREPRDRYGRLLAYVWLADGRLVNQAILERGYATVLRIAPNDRFAPTLQAAEGAARRRGAGVWGRSGCAGAGGHILATP
ncbi:MAG TPA: thermonuclease family protein [Thermoleophilaceae bacterium]